MMMYMLVSAVLATAMLVALIRVVRGPSLADRVVAFDVVAAASVGFLIASAAAYDLMVLIDVALVLALIAFFGTVAFAGYLERRATSRQGRQLAKAASTAEGSSC